MAAKSFLYGITMPIILGLAFLLTISGHFFGLGLFAVCMLDCAMAWYFVCSARIACIGMIVGFVLLIVFVTKY